MPLEAVSDPAADLVERKRPRPLLDRIVVIAKAKRPGDGKIIHDLEPLPLDLSEGIVVHEVAGVDDEVGPLGRDEPADHGGGAIGGRPGIEVGVGDLEEPQGAVASRSKANLVLIALPPVDEQVAEPLLPFIGPGGSVEGADGERSRQGEPGERRGREEASALHGVNPSGILGESCGRCDHFACGAAGGVAVS